MPLISKQKKLKNGKEVTLWFNEDTNSWTLDKVAAESCLSNFCRYIEGEFTKAIEVSGIELTRKKVYSIKRHYETLPEYTQAKIKAMIDEDIRKVDLVYSYILEKIIENKRNKSCS